MSMSVAITFPFPLSKNLVDAANPDLPYGPVKESRSTPKRCGVNPDPVFVEKLAQRISGARRPLVIGAHALERYRADTFVLVIAIYCLALSC